MALGAEPPWTAVAFQGPLDRRGLSAGLDTPIGGVWKLSTPVWLVKQCSLVPHRATTVVVTNLESGKLGSHPSWAAFVVQVVIKWGHATRFGS